MIKILHTADVHLDSPLRSLAARDPDLHAVVEVATRAALRRIVDVALEEEVAAVLIAGDLFDGAERSARTGAYLTAELDRLNLEGIRVFYIRGNHDAENPVSGQVEMPSNVHVFDGRGGKVQLRDGVWIHGVSFSGRHASESLLPRFSAPEPGATNIAMLHTSLAGAAGHDVYAPCSVAQLAEMGFDYWALGHIHRRQVHSDAPWIVMPGMPQGRDIGEAGAKSASLLMLSEGTISVQEVPTASVEFSVATLDVTQLETDDAIRRAVREHFRDLSDGLQAPVGVLRLTLIGTPARHWQILRDRALWSEQIATIAREMGNLWLDKLVLDLAAPKESEQGSGAVEELAEIMQKIRHEPGYEAEAMADMEAVLADLPPGLRAELMPYEGQARMLAEALAEAGAERMLARMKGAKN